jgi:hypothetical protein
VLLVQRPHPGGVVAGAAVVEGDPPAPEHHQVFSHRRRRIQIVGHEDHDAAGGALIGDHRGQPGGAGGIQGAARLV